MTKLLIPLVGIVVGILQYIYIVSIYMFSEFDAL